MHKLLVVDDEFHIRDGIMAIPWASIGVSVVGEAVDGNDALEKCEIYNPDIIITDINMDNMNGLDFAEKLMERQPNAKVVIISGYDEFEYAKRAVDLGVFTYILKPIAPYELIDIIQRLTNEIEKDRKLQHKVQSLEAELKENMAIIYDKFVNDLIGGRISGLDELYQKKMLLEINMDCPFYTCLVFNVDCYYDIEGLYGLKQVQMILLGIKRILIDTFNRQYETLVAVSNFASKNVVCILGGLPVKGKSGLKELISNIEEVKNNIKKILDISISVGIGNMYKELIEISNSYDEAIKALEYKVIAGNDCIVHIDDVVSLKGNLFVYPFDKEYQILKSINEEDENALRSAINCFFKEIEQKGFLKDRIKVTVMELFSVVSRKLLERDIDIYKIYTGELSNPYIALERFDTLEEIRNWLTNLVLGGVHTMNQERRNNVKSVIRKAQEYIVQNFSNQDVSLVSIAEQVYLNPGYFSKLYKKETGESYIDFLTRIRIDEAKRLLKNTNMRISDIGTCVGYPHNQYFCTIFKKVTGITPADYREKKYI